MLPIFNQERKYSTVKISVKFRSKKISQILGNLLEIIFTDGQPLLKWYRFKFKLQLETHFHCPF